jgi:hypothetical protein
MGLQGAAIAGSLSENTQHQVFEAVMPVSPCFWTSRVRVPAVSGSTRALARGGARLARRLGSNRFIGEAAVLPGTGRTAGSSRRDIGISRLLLPNLPTKPRGRRFYLTKTFRRGPHRIS